MAAAHPLVRGENGNRPGKRGKIQLVKWAKSVSDAGFRGGCHKDRLASHRFPSDLQSACGFSGSPYDRPCKIHNKQILSPLRLMLTSWCLQVFFTLVIFQNDRRFGKLTWMLGDSNDTRAQQAYTRLYQVCQTCFAAKDAILQEASKQIKLDGVRMFNASYARDELVCVVCFGCSQSCSERFLPG